MDDKLAAVLATYDERMRDEHRKMRTGFPAGGGEAVRDTFLLAVGPQTGQLINILAGSLAAPNILEIGTSYGYSALWLADAARTSGGRLITMEHHAYKTEYAREMSVKAGVADFVDFNVGDAVQMIADLPLKLDFILLDLWKDLYVPCLEAFYPKLNPARSSWRTTCCFRAAKR